MAAEGTVPEVTRTAFVQNLGDCGLSTTAKLVEAAEKAVGEFDGIRLAGELVKDGTLTAFQAKAILERRFEDLRMGNYEILDKLGAGGMGTVFKARHRRMNRLVALKVLSKEVAATEKFVQRFQREVETIARLSHPNIVMAFDADEAHAGPFLVMEFVNGRDLASEVYKNGPLAVDDAVECILQSARGLEYAHAQGIVHRDIKPGNILRDASGVFKVTDLGLARLNEAARNESQSSLTQAGGVLGTVDFMPPEQAVDSTTIDLRADIYSLGCTLHYLLTGQPPYSGSSIMAVLLKHRDAPIPSLRASRPDIPEALEECFRLMVAKQPGERLASMTDVVRVLEELKRTTHLSDARPATPGSQLGGATIDFSTGDAVASRDTSRVVPAGELPKTISTGGAKHAIVLVEPSRTQAAIIRKYLEQLGYLVVHASGSGKEALDAARQHQARAIISAMHLKDMTGVELARALVADSQCSRIGFILATSETDGDAATELPPGDTVVIMPKPFDISSLQKALAHAVKA